MADSGPGSQIDVGHILSDTYQITGLLGRGGMGSVYTASHMRLPGKRVAVKVLHTGSLGGDVYHRFRREAEITTKIGHPNIVDVLDWNTLADGTPYLVLELLQGESLAARLARGAMPLDTTIHVVRQIGSALAAAHRAGVVHRDLKPDNIFLCPTDSGGTVSEHVKVLDFGISKIQSSLTFQTQEARILGTPQYMAPEQASGKNKQIDQRTDVFALGAIVYEMLTGHAAFNGDNLAAVVYQVVFENPPALDQVRPGLPANVVAAVNRALAKDPSKRYADVLELVAEMSGKPVDTLDRGIQRRVSVDPLAPTADARLPPPSEAMAMGTPAAQPVPEIVVGSTQPVTRNKKKGHTGWWVGLVVAVLGAGGVGVWQAGNGKGTAAAPAPVAPNQPVALVPAEPIQKEPAAEPAPPRPEPTAPPPIAPKSEPEPAPSKEPAPAPKKEPETPTKKPEPTVAVKPPEVKPAPKKEPVVAAPPPSPAQPDAEPDDGDLPDLKQAEQAMRARNYEEAIRLARHSLQTRRNPHAFGLMTRAYCGLKDLSNAKANAQHLRGPLRNLVVRACANMGFPLE